MPAIIKRLTRQGLVDAEFGARSLHDATRHEPRDGVYTVSNTYQRTKTLMLSAHLDRLEESARRQGFALVCDRRRLRASLRRTILESGFGDARFRISASAQSPDEMILSIEPWRPPSPELIASGARCVTSTETRQNPAAKSSAWMHRRLLLEASRPDDIYETILLDPLGNLLEGMTSNVYVIQDGELRTAGSGVLAGVSRSIVLQVCKDIAPSRMEAPNIAEIERFEEAFLSSSSRGIVPVVEIDGIPIGDGGARSAYLDAARGLRALGRRTPGRIMRPMLQKAWSAFKLIGAARDLAIETRRFSWEAAPGATFFLQAEFADIRLVKRERREIAAKIELQAGFGWQLLTDQDEAGVYIIARRKAVIGGMSRGRFEIALPGDAHISLKLEHCQLCLADLNTALDLPPFS